MGHSWLNRWCERQLWCLTRCQKLLKSPKMPLGSFLMPSTRGLHMIQVLQQIQNLFQETVQILGEVPRPSYLSWMWNKRPLFANKVYDKQILLIFACSIGFIIAIIFPLNEFYIEVWDDVSIITQNLFNRWSNLIC